jgi:hypothetical protein
MIDLVLFIFLGLALLIVFVLLGLQGPPKTMPDASAMAAVGQMVSLQGASFIHGERLLDDAEYQLLRTNPVLRPVAERLRKDRRELALLWISSLLSDLNTLWRFRRFLIRRGAPARLREELAILRSFLVAVIFLNLLKVSILTLGPFAFSRMTRRAGRLVESMSHATAGMLGRIPPAGWPELERAWMSTAA